MRLITWNCCRGSSVSKLAALEPQAADVAVIQECERPDALLGTQRCTWFGENSRQGVAIVTGAGFEVHALPSAGSASAYGARVRGPMAFNLLAMWAQRSPTYGGAVLHELERHRAFLLEGPSVVAGDFNTSGHFDAKGRGPKHADIVRVLETEFGLISAYHHHFREPHGHETRPTHYWQWRQAQPFHIDYCFVPAAWASRIAAVSVGSFADWSERSDHRPLTVDIAH